MVFAQIMYLKTRKKLLDNTAFSQAKELSILIPCVDVYKMDVLCWKYV